MAGDEIAERLARLERQLEWTRVELDAVRALAESQAAAPQPELVPIEKPATAAPPPRNEDAAGLTGAWRALERGRASDAVTEAFEVLRYASDSADLGLLDEIGTFASVAVSTTSGRVRMMPSSSRSASSRNASLSGPSRPRRRSPSRAWPLRLRPQFGRRRHRRRRRAHRPGRAPPIEPPGG